MSATRAWSRFQIKSLNDELREFSGIASTPSTDLQGDKIDPLGGKVSLPIPLLWMHNSSTPVGWVTRAEPRADGIGVSCQFAKITEPASLKEEIDRYWAMVKSKLVRGLSIGFRTLKETPISGGFFISEWLWLELSCVVIPANQDASITAIKSASTRGTSLSSSAQRERLARMSAQLDPAVVRARAARLSRDRRLGRLDPAYQLFGLD
ncbi:MAG: HK97 family phage prohead protease [Betaproteobacteria bacterium]|nr:HK97 family phage prohead protease [Betaproteobacteria bacterium]